MHEKDTYQKEVIEKRGKSKVIIKYATTRKYSKSAKKS